MSDQEHIIAAGSRGDPPNPEMDYFQVATQPSTTVVDRRSGAGSHVCGSGSKVHGIDVVFAIGTSAADAQRRAIRARADV